MPPGHPRSCSLSPLLLTDPLSFPGRYPHSLNTLLLAIHSLLLFAAHTSNMRLLGLTFLLAPAVLASAHRHPSGSLHRRQSNYRNFGGLEHVRDHFLDVDVNIDLGLGEDADNGAIIDIDLGIGSGSDHPHFDPNHWLGTKVWKETTSWTGSDVSEHGLTDLPLDS